MRRIRRGEYTLAMISIMGHDPVTGRTYDECHDEWTRERERVEAEYAQLRWWQVRRHIRLRWEIFKLAERLGLGVDF